MKQKAEEREMSFIYDWLKEDPVTSEYEMQGHSMKKGLEKL